MAFCPLNVFAPPKNTTINMVSNLSIAIISSHDHFSPDPPSGSDVSLFKVYYMKGSTWSEAYNCSIDELITLPLLNPMSPPQAHRA
jgi:hypothetical protein